MKILQTHFCLYSRTQRHVFTHFKMHSVFHSLADVINICEFHHFVLLCLTEGSIQVQHTATLLLLQSVHSKILLQTKTKHGGRWNSWNFC